MTVDRADCQYATKELARTMANPTRADAEKGKRIARYLLGRPRAALHYKWQDETAELKIYSDSDWAGCVKTRKSTSGGVIMWGSHALKTYSRQQRTIALSSAEAELYALVAASAEGLGLCAYGRDLGIELKPRVYTDASAALGIAQRRGIGKLRHVQTQSLWVQQAHATKQIAFEKVPGADNPSDMMTKHVPSELLEKHMKCMNLYIEEGRAVGAPQLSQLDEQVRDHDPRRPGGDQRLAMAEERRSAARGMVQSASLVADEVLRARRRNTAEGLVSGAASVVDKVPCLGQSCSACGAERPGEKIKEDEKPKTWSDSEGDCALCAAAMCAALWFGKGRPTRIIFDNNIEIVEVQPYSEVYGFHPSCFDFDATGQMLPRICNKREYF